MNKKEQVAKEFRAVFNKLAWLNKCKMEEALKEYKPSEVHCIEAIGKTVDPNVTKLADSLYMTRGAISKITKKLIKKNVIESYQKLENKKEIYFKLTKQGQEVFDLHEQLHEEFRKRDEVVYEQVTEAQYDDMLRFVKRYSEHIDEEIEKQGIDSKSE
ncbi:MarR family transcriptional regulator [Enterococcus crotali]|uniref:MarR family transcriptional regulator n=1 Tax=Enterococcus crotali TaxID=1453587 RepID=UPI00046F4F0E|nr:MarR family transcriptional regulator [Enterococcus crotali]